MAIWLPGPVRHVGEKNSHCASAASGNPEAPYSVLLELLPRGERPPFHPWLLTAPCTCGSLHTYTIWKFMTQTWWKAPEYYLILSLSGVDKYLPKSVISQPCVRPVELCEGQWLLLHIPWGATAPVTSGRADTTKPWAKMGFLRLSGHTLKMLTHYKWVLH